MNIFSILFIALNVSMDGFFGGLSYGLRGVEINSLHAFQASLWSVPLCMLSMLAAVYASEGMPVELLPIVGGVLFIVTGILSLREALSPERPQFFNNPDMGAAEANLLGIAVAMDGSVAAFSMGLLGSNMFLVPFIFALTHFLLIRLGSFLASRGMRLFSLRLKVIPGLLLVIIGVLKALGY